MKKQTISLRERISSNPKVDEISDERPDDGIWVYLKTGWINPQSETHCIHEDTWSACAKQLRGIKHCYDSCCNQTLSPSPV
jgi:hypothetical protein